MLSIAPLRSKDYYLDLAAEDYYLSGGEPPGYWLGKGARDLGLEGKVEREVFGNIFDGFSQDGSRKLVQNAGALRPDGKPKHHPGSDATFSAPKSVSVEWALGDEERRRIIEAAHRQAVERAVEYLQSVALYTKREHGGVRSEQATGLVAAVFEHGTSRAQDPQLHSHVLIMNIGLRSDGTTGSILGRPLFQHKMTAGAIYRAELAAQLQALGFELLKKEGSFEIASVPKPLIDEFSKRRREIEMELLLRGKSGARAAAAAAVTTRSRKDHVARKVLFDTWRRVGERHAFRPARLARIALNPERHIRQVVENATASLTQDQSYFSEQQFIRRVADEATCRGIGAEPVLKAAREHLDSSPSIVRLGRVGDRLLYSTREIVDLEAKLLQDVEASKKDIGPIVPEEAFWRAIEETDKGRGYRINDEQFRALQHITAGEGSIRVIQGMAGTGKTALLEAARRAFESQGYTVIGAAVAGKAAEGLQAETGIQSTTLARLLLLIQAKSLLQAYGAAQKAALKNIFRGGFRSTKSFLKYVEKAKETNLRLDAKTIIVLDEAAMVGTQQMAKLVEEARKAGSKLVLVGDAGQLQPIDTGAPFPRMGRELGVAELTDIRRQEEDWAKDAVKKMATGQAQGALAEYAERGLLHIGDTRDDTRRELALNWAMAGGADKPEDHLILAGTRADVAILNGLAQKIRRDRGAVAEEGVTHGDEKLCAGDRVLFTKKVAQLGIKNGYTGTVEVVSAKQGKLSVRLDSGKTVIIRLAEHEGIQLGYAVTTHKAQGMTSEKSYILLGGPMQDRELSYTQVSRARGETRLYVERAEVGDTLTTVARDLERSRAKDLAHDAMDRAKSDAEPKLAPEDAWLAPLIAEQLVTIIPAPPPEPERERKGAPLVPAPKEELRKEPPPPELEQERER